MIDFEFYKTIRLSNNSELTTAFEALQDAYSSIPSTKGCLDNINKEGGCNAWCCKIQTPQFLYSEFLLAWKHISDNWDDKEICDLFERCMLNAVDKIPSKGCVFFDEKTCMCKIHDQRAYNCRIYGITPDEEFNPRYEKLEKEYRSIVGAVIKPQCDLISTSDEKELTTDDTDRYWKEVVNVEKMIGIPEEMVTDAMGGSYRTPHDHVLLYNMPENVLNALAGIKEYNDEFDKKRMVREIVQVFKNVFTNNNKS
jgi:Fe-S-cluster containining protein